MFGIQSMRAPRVLLACLLALSGWMAAGRVQAQQINCTTNQSDIEFGTHISLRINRATPYGPMEDPQPPLGLGPFVTCRGGIPGQPLEFALFVNGPNVRANPYGPGVLFDSAIPGISMSVQTSNVPPVYSPITGAFQVVLQVPRDGILVQSIPIYALKPHAVKTGPIDLSKDHKLHDMQNFATLSWRSPGTVDAWQPLTRYSVEYFDQNNVMTETCGIGEMRNATTPYQRTRNLGTIASAAFSGIGSETTARLGGSGDIYVTCRNFAGGTMTVTSTSRHPTMAGVVENGLTGPGAATGVGVRMSARGGGASWDLSQDWTLARPGPGEDFIDYYYTYETRYVQTASTITAGQFSATITFTVNFN